MAQNIVTSEALQRHSDSKSLWLAICGRVYDLTHFLNKHPGGPAVLLRCAKTDATSEFLKVHNESLLEESLPPSTFKGIIDSKSLPLSNLAVKAPGSPLTAAGDEAIPPLSSMANLRDFVPIGSRMMNDRARIYVSSYAGESFSAVSEAMTWNKVTFRPRVLRDVSAVSTSASVLGKPCSLPIFIAPTGMLDMVHPSGELGLAAGASKCRIHYCPSTVSSKSRQQIMEAWQEHTAGMANRSSLFYQLYVPPDRSRAEAMIRAVHELGYQGLFITVDAPTIGKRDEDRRHQARQGTLPALPTTFLEEGAAAKSTPVAEGKPIAGRSSAGTVSSTLNWKDISWLRAAFRNGPLVLKGVQSVEDAVLAMHHGIDGIYISNHGARQLESAPHALVVLAEIRQRSPEVFERCEIYVDGGIMRGADVAKALCLGAKAVGVGRGFLWPLAAYGAKGVERAVHVLAEELAITMRLLGASSLADLKPEMVNVDELCGPPRARL